MAGVVSFTWDCEFGAAATCCRMGNIPDVAGTGTN